MSKNKIQDQYDKKALELPFASPPDTPISFLYEANGLWHYASNCCGLPVHTGIIISSSQITELGCPPDGGSPIGTETEELDPPALTAIVDIARPLEPKRIFVKIDDNWSAEKPEASTENEPSSIIRFVPHQRARQPSKQWVEELTEKRFQRRSESESGYTRDQSRKEQDSRRGRPWSLEFDYAEEISGATQFVDVPIIKARKSTKHPIYWLKTADRVPYNIVVTTAPEVE